MTVSAMTAPTMTGEPVDAPTEASPPAPADHQRRKLLLGLLTVIIGSASIGVAFMPALLDYEPLLLIALSPLGRHFILVAPITAIVPFVAIGSLRKLFAGVVGYHLGKEYGEDGFRWIEGRSELGARVARFVERVFRRFGPLIVFLAPEMAVAALAGFSGMSLRLAVPLMFGGHIMWLTVTHYVGGALSEWILPVVTFLRDEWVPATIICVVLVVLYRWIQKRRGLSPGDLPA